LHIIATNAVAESSCDYLRINASSALTATVTKFIP
jgi:hypothetical protein